MWEFPRTVAHKSSSSTGGEDVVYLSLSLLSFGLSPKTPEQQHDLNVDTESFANIHFSIADERKYVRCYKINSLLPPTTQTEEIR